MNRILTTAAIALALCAPVAAQARMDEITAANFNERYAAVAAINETMRDIESPPLMGAQQGPVSGQKK